MNKFDGRGRQGDWYLYCDICGTRCWASESFLLSTYTGRGGLRVCPSCHDPIDYGLVPYKIPAEVSIPFSRDTVQTADPGSIYQEFSTFDSEVFDWTTTPQQQTSAYQTWDQLNLVPWGSWTVSWALQTNNSIYQSWDRLNILQWADWDIVPWSTITYGYYTPGGSNPDEYGNGGNGGLNGN